MRILHIVPSYKPAYIYGGPIESVASLCEASIANGHQVLVLTTTANGEKELEVVPGKVILVDDVPVIYFPRLTKGNSHISPKLWLYVLRHCREYSIVHIHSWWNTVVIIASLICHWRGVKVVISPRGMLSDYILNKTRRNLKKWIHSTLGRRLLKKAAFHATSQAEFEECQRLIPEWYGFILPNIIRLPPSPFPRSQKRKMFTMLYMSRIHPKKGLEFLFEALSKLTIPVRLRIAGTGDGKYIQALKENADSLRIADRIEWIGWKGKEEKFQELAAVDLFVLTSYNENFANSVIESLYVGTPVLLSREVGLATYIENNALGWVTELNGDVIARSIEAAFRDEAARLRINATGREHITNAFSGKILARRYTEQYQKWVANAI